MHMPSGVRGLLTTLLAMDLVMVGCKDSGPAEPRDSGNFLPSFVISDAVHSSGTKGFFFLPPMVSQPSTTGTFDATSSPRVVICELHSGACTTTIANYTRTEGTGGKTISVSQDHYSVLWDTGAFTLTDAIDYRIEVYIGATRVGFADVDVAKNASEFKNIATGDIIPLVNGRTLPIQFRIEQGIVLAPQEFYVAQVSTFGNILVFSKTATGEVAPLRTIAGPNTGLSQPAQVARDAASGQLYVGNSGGSVTVYAKDAVGDVAPLRNIQGVNTGFSVPSGVAIDASSGELYVVENPPPFKVVVFAPGANGDATPLRIISGPNTGMRFPVGLLLDPNSGELYVANNGNATITVYAKNATGDVAPVRSIGGPNTGLSGPADLAFDQAGRLYVSNIEASTITVYGPGASGDATPLRVIAGANTGLSNPFGLALDTATGELFVANNGNGTITVYASTASGNVSPVRTIGTFPTLAGLTF